MRFTPLGILGFLGLIAPFVGLWFLFQLLQLDWDEFTFRVSRLDWLYVAVGAGVLAILFVPPFFRLYKEYRAWRIIQAPFKVVDDPFIDVDIAEESYGELYLAQASRIKEVAIFVSESNIHFAALIKNQRFGADPLGAARVTLGFAEEFVLVLPWRKRFNAFIPARIALQEESLVGKGT